MVINDSTVDVREQATLGGGCFWCTEAVFSQLDGVLSVIPGYSGGETADPTYQQVCTGRTGHAEVIQITFDPQRISYEQLLEVFFQTHDPTTLNRQGNDVGTQYRSVVFPHDTRQCELAKRTITALTDSGTWKAPIMTTIEPFREFYPAEDDHRDYFALHGGEPYCRLVIQPKIEKFRRTFSESLKMNPAKKNTAKQ